MEFGEAVRQMRLGRGISQEDLASDAGISRQAMSAIENGASPNLDTVLRLAGVLNVVVCFGECRLNLVESPRIAA